MEESNIGRNAGATCYWDANCHDGSTELNSTLMLPKLVWHHSSYLHIVIPVLTEFIQINKSNLNEISNKRNNS